VEEFDYTLKGDFWMVGYGLIVEAQGPVTESPMGEAQGFGYDWTVEGLMNNYWMCDCCVSLKKVG